MKIEFDIDEQDLIQLLADRTVNYHANASKLSQEVVKAVDQKILDHLNNTIAETVSQIFERPIQRHNLFGEKEGKPITLTNIVAEGVEKYLTELVKADGRPGGNYDTRKTRIAWMVEQVALEGVKNEVQSHARKLNAELKAKATVAAAKLLTEMKL